MTVFKQLNQTYTIDTVFSHQETGIKLTYDRDKEIKAWFAQQHIHWEESQTGGVIRGLTNRDRWRASSFQPIWLPSFRFLLGKPPGLSLAKHSERASMERRYHQTGKRRIRYFSPAAKAPDGATSTHFLSIAMHVTKSKFPNPPKARTSGSRLSPYITWGCLSVKQVYQAYESKRRSTPNTQNLDAFISRLLWQSHFIQKFEMEDSMEFQNVNTGYDRIRTEWNEEHYLAWAEGKTGFPLIDAAMNCVKETGWINFRLRATLISFLTHMLWLDWKRGAIHLGKYFLDFEPGIHYPQVQMQAGTTGVNTYRIYNPVKQSQQHDPKGVFIKKWIPALEKLDAPAIHAPWLLGPLEQQWLGFTPGVDYPLPIVDLDKAYKHAQETLWPMNDDPVVQVGVGTYS